MVLKKSRQIGKKKTNKNNSHSFSSKDFKSKDVSIKGYHEIIIIVILLLLDRLTKIWAMKLISPIDYGFLEFVYVVNTGAAFSILENTNWLFIIIASLAVIAMIYYRKYIPRFSLIAILSGTLGNLIDRIFHKGVIDFINFKFFPIFNLADTLISIGVAYWIVQLIREEINSKKSDK
ncbi:MAG TPA: signal peptidase II [Alphaproteobacteria bacterium]|nr:signal peptidase II [Alphaproteobacteria bacterium]